MLPKASTMGQNEAVEFAGYVGAGSIAAAQSSAAAPDTADAGASL